MHDMAFIKGQSSILEVHKLEQFCLLLSFLSMHYFLLKNVKVQCTLSRMYDLTTVFDISKYLTSMSFAVSKPF